MSFGLKVWDGQGRVTLDTTTVAGLFLGEILVNGNGSTTDGRLLAGRPFFMVVSAQPSTPVFQVPAPPLVTIMGSSISWSYPAGGVITPHRILWGIY